MSLAPPGLTLERVLRVLRPLVRLLMHAGVTYPALATALKRVFLDEARAELRRRGMAGTDSALTLLSGVHRRDVRALTRGPARAPATTPAPPLSLASEVVGLWVNHPDFRDAAGAPRQLARGAGEPGSFDDLVHRVSRDVRPRAVLDELLRLGVASENEGGVQLAAAAFVPRQGFDELSFLFAANLHDHAAAAVANLRGEANFLEQAVFVDQISEASARHLQQAAVAAWRRAMAEVLAEARSRFDADQALPAHERRERARFGVYYFSETEE
jgi:hypothetical protein